MNGRKRKIKRVDSYKCSWSALGVSNVSTSCFMFAVTLDVFLSLNKCVPCNKNSSILACFPKGLIIPANQGILKA